MNFYWKTTCPTRKSVEQTKTCTLQGNDWKIIIANFKDKIYFSLEYLGSSYFDIYTDYEIRINDRVVIGNFQFSQFSNEIGFHIQQEDKYEVFISLQVISGHYNSKETTGYVGLRNLGATCYINSFMQTLFHISKFKNDIYKCESKGKILHLQKLFYKMENEDYPIDTTDFVVNNLWDDDIHLHQDIHEFSKVFFDTVEKETKKKEIVESLIQGQAVNFIKAECGCKREIKEHFQDLQVEIRDFYNHKLASTLLDSLRNYTKVEVLNDCNKYKCDEHGFVDAEKGILFSELPPVLFVLLKRFTMDFDTGEGCKVNDYFEFPDILDMAPYCVDEIKKNKDKTESRYKLYSIIVHKGGPDEGHFYAYIFLNDKWYKFNDNIVTIASKEEAMYGNFGGRHPYRNRSKDHSAYYLVYLKESQLTDLLYCGVTIPEKVLNAIKKDDVKHSVKCITVEEIREYNGLGFYNVSSFDYPLSNYREFECVEDDNFNIFKNKIESFFNTKHKFYIFEVIKEDCDDRWSAKRIQKDSSKSCVNGTITSDEDLVENVYLRYVTDGTINVKSDYFIYKSYDQIDFNKKRLVFIKRYVDELWCKDTFPTNLFIVTAVEIGGNIQSNMDMFSEKSGINDPVIYREKDMSKFEGNFDTSQLNHGDVLIVCKIEDVDALLYFMQRFRKRICINVLYDNNSFTMFIERTLEADKLKKAIQEHVMDDTLSVEIENDDSLQFKTANENFQENENGQTVGRCTLVKNSVNLVLNKGKKIVYVGQSLVHIDYNTIRHVHPFVMKQESTSEELIKKILVSPFSCLQGVQSHNLHDIRIVDTVKGALFLKSYQLSEKYTSNGMNVVQVFKKGNYIKGAYYVGANRILGYPFFIFINENTIREFREKYRIFHKLLKFDGNNFIELAEEDMFSDFNEDSFLLIETK